MNNFNVNETPMKDRLAAKLNKFKTARNEYQAQATFNQPSQTATTLQSALTSQPKFQQPPFQYSQVATQSPQIMSQQAQDNADQLVKSLEMNSKL